MENAAKALIMAGGVLIGVLILSLAVYLFADFGSTSAQIQSQVEANRLVQFNAQYTVFVSRTDTTIYEIVSIANKAKENNDYYSDYGNFINDYQIIITLQREGQLQEYNADKMQELLGKYGEVNSEGDIVKRFKCKETYHDNGRIASLIFQQI